MQRTQSEGRIFTSLLERSTTEGCDLCGELGQLPEVREYLEKLNKYMIRNNRHGYNRARHIGLFADALHFELPGATVRPPHQNQQHATDNTAGATGSKIVVPEGISMATSFHHVVDMHDKEMLNRIMSEIGQNVQHYREKTRARRRCVFAVEIVALFVFAVIVLWVMVGGFTLNNTGTTKEPIYEETGHIMLVW